MRKHWKMAMALLCVLAFSLLLTPSFSAQAAGGQVHGVVWLDKTADGVMDREDGVANVEIILEQKNADGTGVSLTSVKTDRQGNYTLSVGEAGEYRLRIKASEEMRFTLHGQSSAALPAQGNISYTPWFYVEEGANEEKNIGLTRSSCYFSFVAFEDENANGGRMNSEPLLRHVQVEILYEYDGETYVVASMETDRNGEAVIRQLSPGTYRVRATMPEPYVLGPIGTKINTFYNCIPAGTDNTGLSEPITLAVKESAGMGIGGVKTGSLSGNLWADTNANGQWDSDEGGAVSAVVSLISDSLGVTRNTPVNADGSYLFRNLQPGNYRLVVTLPEGMIFTTGTSSRITDIAAQGELSASVQVETNTNVGNIGAMPSSTLSLLAYEDVNLNGVMDPDEAPLAGISASIAQQGETVGEGQTDGSGVVRFNTLRNGDTAVSCTLPSGYIFSTPESEGGVFSVTGIANEAQGTVNVPSGETAVCRVGAVKAAAISGMLFEDRQNTGLYNVSCPPVPNATVLAIDAQGQIACTAMTGTDGQYALYPLAPGDYAVRFLLQDPYVAATYALPQGTSNNRILLQTPDYGQTEALTLQSGQALSSVNGAVFRAGVAEGFIYAYDGIGEMTDSTGLSGVTVTLLDAQGAMVSDYSYDTSDETGHYLIKGIMPGVYSLQYNLPNGAIFTSPLQETTEMASDQFVVSSGSELTMPSLGAIQTALISGTVRSAANEGSASVSALISLTGHTLGKTYEVQTGADGQYLLSGIWPDTYTLSVTLPDGYVFSDSGNDLLPATAESQASVEIELAPGQKYLDQEILAAPPVALTLRLFYDENISGAWEEGEPAASAHSFRLLLHDQEMARLSTDEQGTLSGVSLAPGAYTLALALEGHEIMTGYAQNESGEWLMPITLTAGEITCTADVPLIAYATVIGQVWNMDGSFQHVADIPVTLLDANGNPLGSASTNVDGSFGFAGLLPGTYTLSAVLPEGFLFARSVDTQDRASVIQSQADGSASSIPFEIDMGAEVTGLDIGIGAMGGIGDSAWLDENGNGMQDIGESPMPGILIELFKNGEFIVSTTTDVYGHYSLDDLFPGEYEMRVTLPAELKSTLHRTDFPLAASILPESEDAVVTAIITVPSGSRNLHCDLGFQLRQEGVYPANMEQIPEKEWVPYSERK